MYSIHGKYYFCDVQLLEVYNNIHQADKMESIFLTA